MSDRLPGIRSRPTLWRRVDMAGRAAFPACCAVLLLVVLAAPWRSPVQAELQSAAALACVFFWSLFRPRSMAPPVVFLVGLLADLLGLTPPGVSILTLLLAHGLAARWQGLAQQGFLTVWLVFIGVAAGAAALGWALTSLLTLRLLPLAPALFQFGLAAGLYPALAAAFTAAHRGLADPERTWARA